MAVKEDNIPVYRASKIYGVPLTTLRDRVDSRVSVDSVKNGPAPLLSLSEEQLLVEHVKGLARVGYGYTRAEICYKASDFAVYLGKRGREEKPLSLKWFYGFMGRWPELKVVKPSGLPEQRARCASKEVILNYFEELKTIFDKYELHNKPHLVYNIDEKGINTEYRPPNIVAGFDARPQVVMAERSKTVTVIGGGNALGSQIPPFFVFPGQRMLPELMVGKSEGTEGMMTQSGWSNSEVFLRYMKTHFLKYAMGRNQEDTTLVLYDGHKSHISIELIEWAKENRIILFVLPPHCSHILQPMDVGCFGPFQKKYNQECLTYSRLHHQCVTRYDVCKLACKAYTVALSHVNLQASFRKTGIYPLQNAIDAVTSLGDAIAPSELYAATCEKLASGADNIIQHEPDINDGAKFFSDFPTEVSKKVSKPRRNIHKLVGGKAMTEDKTFNDVRQYIAESATRPSTAGKATTTGSPVAGPSRAIQTSDDDSMSLDEDVTDDEKCCVCKKYNCTSKDGQSLAIYTWAQCDVCQHWTHLKYCTPVRVVRRNTSFKCPCC
jgi:hypothetical protein